MPGYACQRKGQEKCYNENAETKMQLAASCTRAGRQDGLSVFCASFFKGKFIMSDKTEITFMQTRLIRLASEEWHLPVEQIIRLFKEADVLGYIEKCYGIFHCEGDEAVLEDIKEFMKEKGMEIIV